VLLAGKFVNDLFGGFSILRNWLVNGSGRHVLEQIGYAESSDWVERMTAAIEKLVAASDDDSRYPRADCSPASTVPGSEVE
jgi:hypothetical protein